MKKPVTGTITKKGWELAQFQQRFLGQYYDTRKEKWEYLEGCAMKYLKTKEEVLADFQRLHNESPSPSPVFKLIEVKVTGSRTKASQEHPLKQQLDRIETMIYEMRRIRNRELERASEGNHILKFFRPGTHFRTSAELQEHFPEINKVQFGKIMSKLGFERDIRTVKHKTVKGYFVREMPQPGDMYVPLETLLDMYDVTEDELKTLGLIKKGGGYLCKLT